MSLLVKLVKSIRSVVHGPSANITNYILKNSPYFPCFKTLSSNYIFKRTVCSVSSRRSRQSVCTWLTVAPGYAVQTTSTGNAVQTRLARHPISPFLWHQDDRAVLAVLSDLPSLGHPANLVRQEDLDFRVRRGDPVDNILQMNGKNSRSHRTKRQTNRYVIECLILWRIKNEKIKSYILY
ncbi:hypothetical protein ALC53_08595 [Atta colombica]|uniref:Uncharacterized protein n=1 Tax=Atta colombica TaxID=520822 RepID=A0A151I252_9HYME|nr:hypothetical protein ALC53_08595 [Atta colombica]